jgi:hypothetical protein
MFALPARSTPSSNVGLFGTEVALAVTDIDIGENALAE